MAPTKRTRESDSLGILGEKINPPKIKKKAVIPPTDAEWGTHKELLRGLYFNSTLPKLMVHMEEDYSFVASKNQYERKFKQWSFRKNLTLEEREHILRKKKKREEAGKGTRVILNGVEVTNKKLKKEESRWSISDLNKICSSYSSAPTPEGLSVSTPPPAVFEILRSIRINNLPFVSLKSLFANMNIANQYSPSQLNEEHPLQNRNLETLASLPLPRSSDATIIPSLLSSFFSGTRGQPGHSTIPSTESRKTMANVLRQATLESHDGDAEARIERLFGPSVDDALREFVTLVAQFGSNTTLEYSQVLVTLDWLMTQSDRFLESLVNMKNAAVQAFLEDLIAGARGFVRKQAFHGLVKADKDHRLFRSRREELLIIAVEFDLADIVEALLEEGIDVNMKLQRHHPHSYQTVLGTFLGAASSVEVAGLLLDAGAYIDTPSYECGVEEWEFEAFNAPTYYAACKGNADLFQFLLDAGAYFDSTDHNVDRGSKPVSVLACAIERRSLAVVKILLSIGLECVDSPRITETFYDVMTDTNGNVRTFGRYSCGGMRTELAHACYLGETDIVEALLSTLSGRYVLLSGKHRGGPLRDAAMRGHEEVVELLIAAGADVNQAIDGDEASTPLMAAVEAGHTDVVRSLLSHKADPNAPAFGKYGTNVLAVAEILNKFETISMLKDAGAVLQRDMRQLQVEIQFEASRKRIHKVKELLASGVDIGYILDTNDIVFEKVGANAQVDMLSTFIAVCGLDNVDARGPITNYCALEHAIRVRSVLHVEALGDSGADFNVSVKDLGYSGSISPLQLALAKKATFQMIDCLLRYGANVYAPAVSYTGQALELAAEYHEYRTLERVLLADVGNTVATSSLRVLQKAIANNKLGIQSIELLLDRADFDARPDDSFGRYSIALQEALRLGRLEIVELLLDRGADINAPGVGCSFGTALQVAIAARNPNNEVIQLLIDKGADIHAPAFAKYGHTALQAAAIQGHLKIALQLLEMGADPNAPGSRVDGGRTAIEGAAERGRLDMVQLLLNSGADPSQTAVDFAEEEKHFVLADMIKEAMKSKGSNGKGVKRAFAELGGDMEGGENEELDTVCATEWPEWAVEDGVDWSELSKLLETPDAERLTDIE